MMNDGYIDDGQWMDDGWILHDEERWIMDDEIMIHR